jgi:hypothetical protein
VPAENQVHVFADRRVQRVLDGVQLPVHATGQARRSASLIGSCYNAAAEPLMHAKAPIAHGL